MKATIPTELLPEEIAALPRVVAELRAEIERLKTERAPERPRLTWASRKRYAEHRDVSLRTVAKWLAEGLPADGAPLRIDVERADAWLAARDRKASS